MERRIHHRYPRRVEIRFWRRGQTQSHVAYTTNISKTGLFLGSAVSLDPGERLRLEVVEPVHGFVVEGRVARVHRVPIALRHVEQPGVGVRFLTPDELVEEYIPGLARQGGPPVYYRPAAPPPPEASAVVAEEPGSAAGRPAAALESAAERPAASSASAAGAGAAAATSKPPSGRKSSSGERRQRIVPVIFDDASSFLSVFHRDIQSGGLFVSSPEPAALNDIVWIELQLPLEGEKPELIPSRVVQRFDPHAIVGQGRNVLSGMAVQFLDPERALAQLRPLVEKLRH